MARTTPVREQAAPSSASQQQRYDRILQAARQLGSQQGYGQVQMVDIAREAGVAIGTVYRYFPSKDHLNTRLLRQRIEHTRRNFHPTPDKVDDPPMRVTSLLFEWAADMMAEESPLSRSMLIGIVSGEGSREDVMAIDNIFHTMILEAAGIQRRDREAIVVSKLIMRCWYGTLLTIMNGGVSYDEGRAELATACELLLTPLLQGHQQDDAPISPPVSPDI